VSEKTASWTLGMRFSFWRVEKVAGTENTAPPAKRSSLFSGSGDGTGGRRPEGGRPSEMRAAFPPGLVLGDNFQGHPLMQGVLGYSTCMDRNLFEIPQRAYKSPAKFL
jgi:hypothetical protein